MELAQERSLKLIRDRGINSLYSRSLLLVCFLYAISVFNLLKFAYHHGTPLLQEGLQLAEIALAAIALLNGYRTHDTYREVRSLLEDDGVADAAVSLVARVFWRAYYNLLGLIGVAALANMLTLVLLDYAIDGRLF
jgi:hypothetical protein